MFRSNLSEAGSYFIKGFVPTYRLPPRVWITLWTRALQGLFQAASAVNDLRRGPSLGANRAAGRMVRCGFNTNQPAISNGVDGAAPRAA